MPRTLAGGRRVEGEIRGRDVVTRIEEFPELLRARSGNSAHVSFAGFPSVSFMGSPNCSPACSTEDGLARRVYHMTRSIVGSSRKVRLLVLVACTWLALSGGVVMAQDKKLEDFNPKSFDGRSTTIDNEWFPLKPGTRLVYAGTTIEDDGKPMPRRLVSIVTDLIKVIDGVRTVVVWDVDHKDGQLAETEIAFFAQDNDGNVWLLGEYPEEWEGGKYLKSPAWLHGREGARAGIAMKAKPQLGTPSYAQGWGPAVRWTDRATVDQMGQKTCVRKGCYENVLVIAETSREEPNAEQLKYYARGVGNVRVGWRGKGEKLKETLELIEVVQLGPEALAQARAKALALDKRAYRLSKKAYENTPPAEQTTGRKSSIDVTPMPTSRQDSQGGRP
jgi:hypothetical protein